MLATVTPSHLRSAVSHLVAAFGGRPFATTTIGSPNALMAALATARGPVLISSPAFMKRALTVLDLAALRGLLARVFSSAGPLLPNVAVAYNRACTPVIGFMAAPNGRHRLRSVLQTSNPFRGRRCRTWVYAGKQVAAF